MNEKKILIGIILATLIAVGVWMFFETRPRVGNKLEEAGRDHVPVGTQVEYKTNPPTSGPHFADPAKPGIYERVIDDSNLVHSLEHGYVIISYNCAFKQAFLPALIRNVSAHGTEEEEEENSTSSAEIKYAMEDASASAQIGPDFLSDECHTLVDNLIAIYEAKGKRKMIIVPRPALDAKIALTAWNYIDKFNEFDKGRIEKFIDSNLDKGPEKTME